MPLSDTAIRNAKPAEKPVRLFDAAGLYLELSPSGGKLWRLKYRFGGKEKRLSFGVYPDVTLKEARERRDEARKLLANGKDPGEVKKAQKAAIAERSAHAFEAVARAWFEKWKTGVTESTAQSQWKRLVKHIVPVLGALPVSEITAPKVLSVLSPLEERGTGDTLRKAKMAVSQIV